jgi:hypothetical protein
MRRFFGLLFSLSLIAAFCYAQTTPVADNGLKFEVNPNPHTINQTIDTPLEEVFGLNQNLFAGGVNRARGNFFTCTTSRRVIEHRMYLNPTAATNLYFCIYEGDAQVGTYNQISAVLVTGQGPGEGWYSSGPIDVTLTAGKFYVIYTQMDAQTAYWTENPVSPFPDPCSFGMQTGGAGWATGSVPIYGNPPPASQTFTSAAFVDPVAYYQTIVTDDISSGFGLPEVLYYLFDEAGSTTTQNFASPGSGSQFADVLGGLTMGPTGQFDDGLIGSGNPSSTDYVNTGWIPDLGTSNWTISLYLNNLPAGTALNYLFGGTVAVGWRCFYSGAAGQYGVLMRLTGIGGSDITVPGVGPGPSVLTFVYDSSVPTVYAYINGVLAVTQPQAGALNMTGSDNFKVGGYGTSAGMPAGSIMDEFRFYNRALDAAEVAATWNISIVPVELTSFTASVIGSDVKLLWQTASELNNSGFSVERKIGESEFMEVAFVPGFGTTSEPKSYSFTDQNLRSGQYTYRLKQIDFDGTFTYSNEVAVDVVAPASFSLDQNYPNPFNPSTRITFSLAVDSKVSLKVFDVLGQQVASLIDQDLTQGVHTYDFNAAGINSGVYFYKIEATGVNGSEFTDVKKMILVK